VGELAALEILLGLNSASKRPFLVLLTRCTFSRSPSIGILSYVNSGVQIERAFIVIKIGKLDTGIIWERLLKLTVFRAATRELELREQLMFIQLMDRWLKIIHQFFKLFLSIPSLILVLLLL
jgi:hypothetical protein